MSQYWEKGVTDGWADERCEKSRIHRILPLSQGAKKTSGMVVNQQKAT